MQFNCLLKFLNDRKVKLALETGNPETGNEVEEEIGDIRLQLQLIYDIVFERDFTFLPFKIYIVLLSWVLTFVVWCSNRIL